MLPTTNQNQTEFNYFFSCNLTPYLSRTSPLTGWPMPKFAPPSIPIMCLSLTTNEAPPPVPPPVAVTALNVAPAYRDWETFNAVTATGGGTGKQIGRAHV